MKFIAVDSNASPKTERLRRSCRHHGIPLEVIAEGRPYPNNGVKVRYILEYLGPLAAEETVVVVDAYDVVFLAGVEEIEAKYRAFGHPFVISTEQNCNVDGGLAVRLPVWLKYPKGRRPYRFVNAGSYVGAAGYMRELLPRLRLEAAEREQSFFNRFYADHPDSMALDYGHELFTCTAGRTGLEDGDYRVEDGRLRNTVTGSLPAVLHCPGKNYLGLDKLTRPLPFAGPAYRASPAERRSYRKSRFVNRLNAWIYPDNFIFHLALDAGLVLLALVLAALAIGALV